MRQLAGNRRAAPAHAPDIPLSAIICPRTAPGSIWHRIPAGMTSLSACPPPATVDCRDPPTPLAAADTIYHGRRRKRAISGPPLARTRIDLKLANPQVSIAMVNVLLDYLKDTTMCGWIHRLYCGKLPPRTAWRKPTSSWTLFRAIANEVAPRGGNGNQRAAREQHQLLRQRPDRVPVSLRRCVCALSLRLRARVSPLWAASQRQFSTSSLRTTASA